MTSASRLSTCTVPVPGARLYYEVRRGVECAARRGVESAARRGGPVLLILGAPMSAAEFTPLAHAMAVDHTVVTTDPRGIAASVVDDPTQDSTPELRADDVAAILDDLGVDSADVFGSSGGAVTGLALVARHPDRVRTLVAHEPPLLELLPDADAQRAATDEIVATFHRDGHHAAFAQFMITAGFDLPDGGGVGPATRPDPNEDANAAHFFAHELRPTTRYLPDIEALRNGRVVLGLGVDSGRLLTQRTTVALAELLGTSPFMFPGDHGGFLSAPGDFADTLRLALA